MLTSKQIAFLKALSHHKNPIVTIGSKGLTGSVIKEINLALTAHELIKIQVQGADRELRAKLMHDICAETNAESVNIIGKLLVIFRPSDKKIIELPK